MAVKVKSDDEATKEFLELLVAAMMDAARGNLTQLQTSIAPDGMEPQVVRVVFLPEKMAYTMNDELVERRHKPS